MIVSMFNFSRKGAKFKTRKEREGNKLVLCELCEDSSPLREHYFFKY